MRREFTAAGLAHTLFAGDRAAPVVLIRTPYGRQHHFAEARGWVARGFSCVVGDVRGRGGSAGDFRPYRTEAVDGAGVVDALRRLGFRRVIAAGASYAAYCAVTAAIARPDVVVGVLAAVPALGLGETAREPGGAARLACRAGWWGEHVGTVRSTDLRHTPVADLIDGWDDLWAAPERTEELWTALPRLRAPLLAVGGLHDPFAADTVRLAREWGGPSRLLLGPWGHELDAPAPGAALAGRRIGELYVAWARALADLRGGKEFIAVSPDSNGWRRLSEDCEQIHLQVARGGFTADPDRPFRSVPLGAPIPEAENAAVLLSPTLRAGEVRGGISVTLTAVADTPDADWVVRLSLDGTHLAHAVHRRTHTPGEPATFTIDLPPIGQAVPDSARLTFEVAGHHWPRHARNPHTGEDPVRATALLPSRRTVLRAAARIPRHPGGTDTVPAAALPEEVAS
ncbi:CocE/NonD family hydrolase [Saccharothrix mutabilis subsp. mutabilis]|uniref:CocE/NonD family hydrolase n=1 Tax=Saccharothrix mutabilis subsp. mutabilis TaxID=66855 RepID=A0ABN0T3W3_9PSEU